MSNKDRAIQLLNVMDDEQMTFVVRILENLIGFANIPNDETLAAFKEVDEMKRSGSGQRFGNLDDLWTSLEE